MLAEDGWGGEWSRVPSHRRKLPRHARLLFGIFFGEATRLKAVKFKLTTVSQFRRVGWSKIYFFHVLFALGPSVDSVAQEMCRTIWPHLAAGTNHGMYCSAAIGSPSFIFSL